MIPHFVVLTSTAICSRIKNSYLIAIGAFDLIKMFRKQLLLLYKGDMLSVSNLLMTAAKDLFHPILMLLANSRSKFRIVVGGATSLLPNKPVIFAVNHTNSFDTPIVVKAISSCYHLRCQILAGKQPLYLLDRLYFILNGVFWVDRKNKKETSAVKQKVIDYLGSNPAILWFPEGTWNQTDNLLMLPMKWGIVDVASTVGAQILPVILNYDRLTMICHVSFGKPLSPEKSAKKSIAIRDLRDSMASLFWGELERERPLHRAEVSIERMREEMLTALLEYPPLNWENEKTIIFSPNVTEESAFAHLESLVPSHENAFLYNKRLKR